MIGSLDIGEDQIHLDVAAGTGEPGLTISARAPRGSVVITDISSGMLGAAERRAASQGLAIVEFGPYSADDLPFDGETFDSVSCRFGFMFFPDVSLAVAEL